ncbi:MAG: T9SS type A sorting domain-containing protein [Candidatus Neomarinimicrobiota bacterium]
MKSLVKIQLLVLITAVALTSFASAQITATARPAMLPTNSYLNGGDGDHYFWQQVQFAPDVTPLATETYTIAFPAGITIASTDDDANYNDEIYVANAVAAGAAATLTPSATAANNAIIITVTAVGGFVATDAILVTFPAITGAAASSGLTYTVTATTAGSTPGTSNAVAIADSALSLASFDDTLIPDKGTGKVSTNNLGRRHPDDTGGGAQTYTAALPDLNNDMAGVAAATTVAATETWWPGAALDNVNNNGEITFQLWASQTKGLKRITSGSGQLALDASTSAALTAVNEAATLVTAASDPDGALDISGFADGNWWFYITSNATDEFVLGESDTVEVRHYPTFMDLDNGPVGFPIVAFAPFAGAGDGIDYDHDGLFEPSDAVGAGSGAGDDAAVTTLESGGTIGRSGSLVSGTNPAFDSVNVYWQVEDLNDNARVHVFQSTNTALTVANVTTAAGLVTGLTGATEITSSAQYEEDPINYVTWTTYTSSAVFETAGIYTLYIVAYDSTNLAFRKVGQEDGTALATTVKHHPYFKFHDVYSAAGADGQTFDSGTDQYIIISWGETVDGDKDVDAAGTAVIKLYIVPELAGPTNQWADIVNASDPTSATSLSNLQAVGTLLTTITDDGDLQSDNRYLYDARAAGLTGANYNFWAHMTHGTDNIISQYNSSANPVIPGSPDDRTFAITHATYLRVITPSSGPPIEIDQSDRFRMEWEAFDQNAGGTERIQVALALEGVANPGGSNWTAWIAGAATNIVWVVEDQATVDGANPAAGVGVAAANGSAIVDMTDITTTSGGGTPATGNYDVYYFYTEDGTFDGETPTKAPGQIYLTNITTDPYDIELLPNKAHMAPGDTLTVDLYATDDGTDTDKAIFSVVIPNASYFTLVDQDATEDDIQPFDNDLGAASPNALGGAVLLNTVGTTADGSYLLGYMELNAAAQDVTVAGGEDMVSFQLVMTADLTDPLEDIEITFGSTDPNVTNFFDPDGSPQSTSLPPVALALKLGQAGKLTGVVDVEGRTDKDEIVTFSLVSTGSVTPITTASYLTANGDADGTDGVQITLQGGGYYELEGIPTGEYDILVSKTRYASSLRANVKIASMGTFTQNFSGARKLLGGDAGGYVDTNGTNIPDNRINATDIAAITAAGIGATSASGTWNTYADIDESGTVDVNDLFMSAKNTGTDGGGIFYKEIAPMPGSNADAIAYLAYEGESAEGAVYSVQAGDLASLSAFSARLSFNNEEWKVLRYSDGLARHANTIHLDRLTESELLYASAVRGHSNISQEKMDLMNIVMRSLVDKPAAPALAEVTLIDGNGTLSKAVITSENALVPDGFALSKNYPNPFNPNTNIDFSLPKAGEVRLAIYNLLGQEVSTLVARSMDAGAYKATWNARDNAGRRVTSGVYFYRLTVNNEVVGTHKMVLLK